MRKKTALQIPGDRKASSNQTKGLVAKGEKPRQSGQEGCVLDNHSHRTVCVSAAPAEWKRCRETLSSRLGFFLPAYKRFPRRR